MRWILETERLHLRELEPEDLDFLAALLGDPEGMRFYPKALSREESGLWLERQRSRYGRDGHGLWLVEEKATGQPVGQVGVLEQDLGDAVETEVGYMIARAHWRRGLATEAARACRDHAFERLARPRVVSLIRPENVPSQGVARAMGMAAARTIEWRGSTTVVFQVSRPDPRSR